MFLTCPHDKQNFNLQTSYHVTMDILAQQIVNVLIDREKNHHLFLPVEKKITLKWPRLKGSKLNY